MNFFNRKIAGLDLLIIGVGLLVFLIRLFACRHVFPIFEGMDYYGYIELAKNIFHRLDFTVRWELDSPLQYPPFFSILIYLMTCLTKNFIISIRLINVLSAGLYLIPLFYLVRNILNTFSAVFAVIFTTYYFGLNPCRLLCSDFFYSLLVIMICWLIWDTLINKSWQERRYVLAGVLISFAYLTKYSGTLFCFAAMVSILYYFTCHQQSIKVGIKMSAFLLLGFAPLFLAYQFLLNNSSKGAVPTISAYTFFDGNYMYQKGIEYRREKISEINPEGTEFSYVSFLKKNDVASFSIKNPNFVIHKYLWGLEKISEDMAYSVLPNGAFAKSSFYNIGPDGGRVLSPLIRNGILSEVTPEEVIINPFYDLKADSVRKAVDGDFYNVWIILRQYLDSRMKFSISFQWVFIFLLMLSGFYFKWPFKMMHILIFTIGMAFIPFYHSSERYLIPFMPLYFILWLFILNAGHCFLKRVVKNEAFSSCLVLAVFAFFVSVYFIDSCKQIYENHRYFGQEVEQNEKWLQTASWIKKDSMALPKRAKIMSADDYLSYLTDSDYIRLPSIIMDWNKVINFAVLKHVNYMVIDGKDLDSFKEAMPGIKINNKKVLILKI